MRSFDVCLECEKLMVKARVGGFDLACEVVVQDEDWPGAVAFREMQSRNPGVDCVAEARNDQDEVEDFEGRHMPSECPLRDTHESIVKLREL